MDDGHSLCGFAGMPRRGQFKVELAYDDLVREQLVPSGMLVQFRKGVRGNAREVEESCDDVRNGGWLGEDVAGISRVWC